MGGTGKLLTKNRCKFHRKFVGLFHYSTKLFVFVIFLSEIIQHCTNFRRWFFIGNSSRLHEITLSFLLPEICRDRMNSVIGFFSEICWCTTFRRRFFDGLSAPSIKKTRFYSGTSPKNTYLPIVSIVIRRLPVIFPTLSDKFDITRVAWKVSDLTMIRDIFS